MKKLIFAFITLTIAVACNKPQQILTEETSKSTVKKTRAKKCNLDYIIKINSKGESYPTCPHEGNSCYKSKKYLHACESAALVVVKEHIVNGIGNTYFNDVNYRDLFSDVDDIAGLKERILNNEVNLICFPSEEDAEVMTFVLSTATNRLNINQSNTFFVWEY